MMLSAKCRLSKQNRRPLIAGSLNHKHRLRSDISRLAILRIAFAAATLLLNGHDLLSQVPINPKDQISKLRLQLEHNLESGKATNLGTNHIDGHLLANLLLSPPLKVGAQSFLEIDGGFVDGDLHATNEQAHRGVPFAVTFRNTEFNGKINFKGLRFEKKLQFSSVTMHDQIFLQAVRVGGDLLLNKVAFPPNMGVRQF